MGMGPRTNLYRIGGDPLYTYDDVTHVRTDDVERKIALTSLRSIRDFLTYRVRMDRLSSNSQSSCKCVTIHNLNAGDLHINLIIIISR